MRCKNCNKEIRELSFTEGWGHIFTNAPSNTYRMCDFSSSNVATPKEKKDKMPTIENYVTPAFLEVVHLSENGDKFDSDEYAIESRENFIAHLLRIEHELSNDATKKAFRDFAEKLSWSTFYGADKGISFRDEVDGIRYDFYL